MLKSAGKRAHLLSTFCASLAAAGLFLLSPGVAGAAVLQVQSVGITVNDLDREALFFKEVLGFEEVGRAQASDQATADLLGLPRVELNVATLRLGGEILTLTRHSDQGRPIPPDSRSYDRWFQHIAIVVSDMNKAFASLRRQKVKFVSTAPQTLPDWNKAAAGIKAFYFRDPEDHVLEIIWFPNGKGDPRWQTGARELFLGIDHTAIVVSDTDASLAFYRDLLGLRVAGESENYGVEQEHLNQVFGARVRITSLRADRGPGIEFLEYLTPPGGRPFPKDAKANDLVFWHTDLTVDHLDGLAARLKPTGAALVSRGVIESARGPRGADNRGLIIRDPDGHALELLEPRAETAVSGR